MCEMGSFSTELAKLDSRPTFALRRKQTLSAVALAFRWLDGARVVEGEMFDSEAGPARAFQNDALVREAANKARSSGCRRHVSEEICT
jgi:hypothetical protein